MEIRAVRMAFPCIGQNPDTLGCCSDKTRNLKMSTQTLENYSGYFFPYVLTMMTQLTKIELTS